MSDDRSPFLSLARERTVILDGAMGTSIHALDLPLSDYRGLENCCEVLNLSRPDSVEGIHRSFLEVGCDVVETNTFGGMKHVLAEFGLADQCVEINRSAARIARRAVQAYSVGGPRFVAGSLGPGTKLVTLRQISYDELLDSYFTQACGLLEGGVDVMVIETCQDILQCKCVIHAVRRAFEQVGRRTPLMVSVTMETTGTMLVGTDIAAALTAIDAYPEVDVIGLNCATGPQEMSEHIRYLARTSTRLLSVMPNAGLPQVVNGAAHFPLAPAELARWLREFVATDGVNIVGGCCGTTPEHMRAVVEAVRPAPSCELRVPRVELQNAPSGRAVSTRPSTLGTRTSSFDPSVSSLYQSVPMRQDNSFLIVGERCNTNGSRKFKQMLADGDFDGCVHLGIEQVKDEGAHVLDVCVDFVGRDGVPDMHAIIDRFSREVTAPLMLDSTQLDVLETGLKLAGGKCIVNSVNLEDGEEKLARVARLCRQYGAAVVALTIDEDPVEAMAKTAERKLQIATRIRDLLVERHGMREEDIFWDCLTFPITTGNQSDRRLGLETLDGIEAVMRKYPRCQSILGVSNVSFGLQPLARVVLNSVFLHEARQRGLTAAIVNPGKILPRTQISDERWNAALDLIYDRRPVVQSFALHPTARDTKGQSGALQSEDADSGASPLERFIGLFSADEKVGAKSRIADLPIEERLTRRIIDGNRVGLESDLDEAMTSYPPLEIINRFLLDGMKIVGELFGSGQMQLPFVLKSAETMKAAVARLEPHMERVAGHSRGRIVLATVRGDVHDIGKNLVDIILTNNGYTVYNLGIKQPINNVIAAFHEHRAQAIGLSGLLVKSTLVMRDDLGVLNEQRIDVPVILGGAALTRKYVEEDLRSIYDGALFYARDAFDGLSLMSEICEGRAPRTTRPASVATAQIPAARAAAAPADEPDSAQREIEARTRNLDKLQVEIEQRYGLRDMDEADAPQPQPAEVVRAASGRSDVTAAPHVPTPPFWGARVVQEIPLRAALAYVNETMLFQVQWGFRRKGRSPAEWKQHINAEIRPIYRQLVERCEREGILQCQAVYGYWPCHSQGDDLILYEPPIDSDKVIKCKSDKAPPAAPYHSITFSPSHSLREIARFTFPRQKQAPYRCLADFWRPVGAAYDVVAFHLVTAGQRVSEVAREWFRGNQYQQYLFLHGLGVEVAEALAEYLHKQIRVELGIADQDARELQMLFKQGYRGSRYSFGYPACPRLEDQQTLFELLRPERIGVQLSEEYQLDPEQSTSALIAHHPQARYFNVR